MVFLAGSVVEMGRYSLVFLEAILEMIIFFVVIIEVLEMATEVRFFERFHCLQHEFRLSHCFTASLSP